MPNLTVVQPVYQGCEYDAPKFNDFWAIYPKRVAKKDALKAWDKLNTEQREDAIAAIPNHVRYWIGKRVDPKFIPYPATWLNGWRWEDSLVFEDSWSPLASSMGK